MLHRTVLVSALSGAKSWPMEHPGTQKTVGKPWKKGQFRQSSDKTLAPGRGRVQAAGGAAAMGRSKKKFVAAG